MQAVYDTFPELKQFKHSIITDKHIDLKYSGNDTVCIVHPPVIKSINKPININITKNSKIKLIELYSNGSKINNSNINIDANSNLQHIIMQCSSEPLEIISNVNSKSNYQAHYACSKGNNINTNITVNLLENSANCDLKALQAPILEYTNKLNLLVNHKAQHTNSKILQRGLAKNNAVAYCVGKIYVAKNAADTKAHFESKNLILDPFAKAHTCPQLEIYNDAVQCSHGATVGHLDEQALFYCTSRGISYEVAKQLLMQSFINCVTSDLEQHAPFIMQEVKCL